MKELIKSYYDIDCISFIKLSDKAYRIKSNNKDYVLKYIDTRNIDIIIEKLSILKIDAFLFPLINNFIIYEWLKEEKVSIKDLKLKFFLSELAYLHNKTFYTLKVNETFFKDTYEYIGNKIDMHFTFLFLMKCSCCDPAELKYRDSGYAIISQL